jgi:pimeloyl-ACP methyl ester carboxylesterase
MNDSTVMLSDGRQVAFTDMGDPGGAAIFFFHGAPDSRLSIASLEREFADRTLRVISPDRPGYGASSPQPGRSMADWPPDVAAVADALGIERFMVSGYSSGGPYAIACAALLPDRVMGAIVLSGITDVAWTAAWNGIYEAEVAMMRLPDEQAVVARCEELFGADGSDFLTAWAPDLSEPDLALLSETGVESEVREVLGEAFRQGVIGYAQDVFVQGRPWPFSCDMITAPVIVAHGELDATVPIAHSHHTAELIPGASLRILPGHGHLTIYGELPGLCAELLGR